MEQKLFPDWRGLLLVGAGLAYLLVKPGTSHGDRAATLLFHAGRLRCSAEKGAAQEPAALRPVACIAERLLSSAASTPQDANMRSGA